MLRVGVGEDGKGVFVFDGGAIFGYVDAAGWVVAVGDPVQEGAEAGCVGM